jgi:zinc protease
MSRVGVMRVIIGVLLISLLFGCLHADPWDLAYKNDDFTKESMKSNEKMAHHGPGVIKKVLKNGMTILVRPVHMIPKVSIQLWYYVGSKDEKDSERGIAHLIEHMIFKGTEKLSESDINTLTHKLSSSCNAFTSYDYTGYLFNMPSQHWHEALPVMADCMRNCSFKEEMLSSEMKAVVQELKMYRDRYLDSLVTQMLASIFPGHPYHHPIIGYKQDLWSVDSEDLRAFYKKHYVPNNATLVIVGDVDPNDVFAQAEQFFGPIAIDPTYKKQEFYLDKDIATKAVTIYREVAQPTVAYAFLVPGMRDKKDHVFELLPWILGKGKTSRLHKLLVDELHLATAVSASYDELFDHGIFFITAEPKSVDDIPRIERAIVDELRVLCEQGVSDAELERALKQSQMDLYSLLEDIEDQAYNIGKYFLATGDPEYVFTYLDKDPEFLKAELNAALRDYFREPQMHKGAVLPLPASEKADWAALQKRADKEDEHILSGRTRDSEVEPASYALGVQAQQPKPFDFPKAQTFTLSNGIKVFAYDNPNTPQLEIMLSLKAKHFYEPDDKLGILRFINAMLPEGTENYPGHALADAVESRGMGINTYPGGISMNLLSDDFVFGTQILRELVDRALFDEKEIEKVRGQLVAKLKYFWDEPRYFAGQLIREYIYRNHPYSKNSMGNYETIANITRQDLLDGYKKYISPHGARLAVVGDLGKYDVRKELERYLGDWQGAAVASPDFPPVHPVKHEVITHPINRDQVVLSYAGVSVNRLHPDFDRLLLFDQVFSGGSLGSMSSRLFELREQSGLFYTISGSLIAGADEQPGMVVVSTIVSLDRLQEAQEAITELMNTVAQTVTLDEFEEAKDALSNTLVDHFASNQSIANAFLFLDRFGYPADYFDTRAQQLHKIKLEEVRNAAEKILDTSKMVELKVGRVE